MAKYRLTNQTKKNLKVIESAFTAGGFDKKEAIALSRAYYGALSDKTDRLIGIREIDTEYANFAKLLAYKQSTIKDKDELAKFNKTEFMKSYDTWVRTGDLTIHEMFFKQGLMNEPEIIIVDNTLDELD